MNKIMNNISDTRKIFAGLLVGVLSLAGCAGKLDEPVNPTDDPLQFPDETQVTFKADITKASGEDTPHYAYNEIHMLNEANCTFTMPGASEGIREYSMKSSIDPFFKSFSLKVNDFNLSTGKNDKGNPKIVSRWTQVDVKKDNDHLIAAARLDVEGSGNGPVLDYKFEHTGTKLSVRFREVPGNIQLGYQEEKMSVSLHHQVSSADYFVEGKRLLELAVSNTADPTDASIQNPVLCNYRSTAKYTTTEFKAPVLLSGSTALKPRDIAVYTAIVPATPNYIFNSIDKSVIVIPSSGVTDEDYLLVTISDDYLGTDNYAGGTYKIKLSDITLSGTDGQKLTHLEAGKHLSITLYIDYNNLVLGTAEFCEWDEAVAEGNLYGDDAFLDPYTVSEDGKTYTVNQIDGLYAWAKALNESQTKDINLILSRDIRMPEMEEGKSNWEIDGDLPYVGTIDGQGHTIENLTVLAPNSSKFGFIPVLGEQGVIRNLTIKNIKIGNYVGTPDFAGSVVAYNDGTIIDCHADGVLISESANNYIGGIAGQNNGMIIKCTNAAEMTAYSFGGIAHTNNGYVFGCFNYGTITCASADHSVGGIVANNVQDVVACANRGALSGNSDLLGCLVGNNTGKLVASWSSNGETLVGSGSSVECHYYSSPSDYIPDTVNEINKAVKAYNETSVVDSPFGWTISATDKWLELIDYTDDLVKTDYEMSNDGKTMTVYTYSGLYEWERRVNNGETTLNLTLGGDITLPAPRVGESNWTPVCYQTNSTYNYYNGTINGQGYKIIGMTIIRPTNTTGYANGDLGFVSILGAGGKISNVIFENATVAGTTAVGVVAGEIADATIEACLVTGNSSVTGSFYVGGIVGLAGIPNESTTGNSLVIACGSVAEVSGNNAGATAWGSAYGCWSTDNDDFGKNYSSNASRIVGCVVGDAAAINAGVDNMNSALADKGSQWRWVAGMNGSYPTLNRIN